MGAFLDKPKTEKFNESGSAAHGTLRYGLASMQGFKLHTYNEMRNLCK